MGTRISEADERILAERTFAGTTKEWDAIAKAVAKAGICGSDTETYGHDVRKSTPTYRSKIHVWSIAVRSSKLHPRGHHIAVGRTLPVEALTYPPIKEILEDWSIIKVYHNAPHDVHAKRVYGVNVQGFKDTLAKARHYLPGLDSYGLKQLCRRVGRTLHEYKATVSVPRFIDRRKEVKVCSCGQERCRKRLGHIKTISVIEWKEEKGLMEIPLESITPGHPNWNRLVLYACEDAVTALELDENLDDSIPEAPEPLIIYDVAAASRLLHEDFSAAY